MIEIANLFHNITVFFIFDQINTGLMSIRDSITDCEWQCVCSHCLLYLNFPIFRPSTKFPIKL